MHHSYLHNMRSQPNPELATLLMEQMGKAGQTHSYFFFFFWQDRSSLDPLRDCNDGIICETNVAIAFWSDLLRETAEGSSFCLQILGTRYCSHFQAQRTRYKALGSKRLLSARGWLFFTSTCPMGQTQFCPRWAAQAVQMKEEECASPQSPCSCPA